MPGRARSGREPPRAGPAVRRDQAAGLARAASTGPRSAQPANDVGPQACTTAASSGSSRRSTARSSPVVDNAAAPCRRDRAAAAPAARGTAPPGGALEARSARATLSPSRRVRRSTSGVWPSGKSRYAPRRPPRPTSGSSSPRRPRPLGESVASARSPVAPLQRQLAPRQRAASAQTLVASVLNVLGRLGERCLRRLRRRPAGPAPRRRAPWPAYCRGCGAHAPRPRTPPAPRHTAPATRRCAPYPRECRARRPAARARARSTAPDRRPARLRREAPVAVVGAEHPQPEDLERAVTDLAQHGQRALHAAQAVVGLGTILHEDRGGVGLRPRGLPLVAERLAERDALLVVGQALAATPERSEATPEIHQTPRPPETRCRWRWRPASARSQELTASASRPCRSERQAHVLVRARLVVTSRPGDRRSPSASKLADQRLPGGRPRRPAAARRPRTAGPALRRCGSPSPGTAPSPAARARAPGTRSSRRVYSRHRSTSNLGRASAVSRTRW